MPLHATPLVPGLIGITGDADIIEWREVSPAAQGHPDRTPAGDGWYRLATPLDQAASAICVAHPELPGWARPVELISRSGLVAAALACGQSPGSDAPESGLCWLRTLPLPAAPVDERSGKWSLWELRLRAAALQLLSQPQVLAPGWAALCDPLSAHFGARAVVAARIHEHATPVWTRRGEAARAQALTQFMTAQLAAMAAPDDHHPDPATRATAWPRDDQVVLSWMLRDDRAVRVVIGICVPAERLHMPMLRVLHEVLCATVQGLEARRRVQQLHGILSTTPDAVVTVDRQLKVRLFNAAAERMFGIRAADILGQGFERLLPPTQRAMHLRAMRALATSEGQGAPQRAVRMLTAVRPDGESIPIEAAISSFGNGTDLRITAILRDATDLRDALTARQAESAARAANEAKTAFMSRMSHELRTPLNAVLGFSQLLLHSSASQLDAGQARKVQHIIDAGQHLLRLIDDVLDIGRIESGAMRIRAEPVELDHVVAEAIEYVTLDATRERVAIEMLGGRGEWPSVTGDATRLRQVLLNLLGNAIKYNRPGGRVTVGAMRDGRRVVLEIADTGRGMTPNQLSHLFEPFNRLGRERGKVSGTGLGLALSKQLVEAMGGNIEVSSSPGAGTRVRLILRGRARGAEAAANGATADVTPPQVPAPPPLRGKLLYVEDNPVNHALIDALLQQWPEVTRLQARSGADGLRLAALHRPDVVLLDMQLGDLHGLEFLDHLRSQPTTAGLRVVALSASATDTDRASAQQRGVDEYWSKPLDVGAFLSALPRWLPPYHASGAARDKPGFSV